MTRNTRDLFDLRDALGWNPLPLRKRSLRQSKPRGQPCDQAPLGSDELHPVHEANISAGDTGEQGGNINPIYADPPDDKLMELGAIVRQARERLGLKQSDLASRINVKQSAVSQWENGKATPSLENRISLAAALNIPLSDLLPEAGEVPREALANPRIRRLIQNYLSMNAQQREAIDLVVERLREAHDRNS